MRDRGSGIRTEAKTISRYAVGLANAIRDRYSISPEPCVAFIGRMKWRSMNPSISSHLPLVTGVLVEFISFYLFVVHM